MDLIAEEQAKPTFRDFEGSKEDLLHSIGLEIEDLDKELPILYGNTGIWTLLVPIKKVEAFRRMKPHNQQFPQILKEEPKCSVHPICMETTYEEATMHARHFSSPYSGTVEDAVTGTAVFVKEITL